MDGHCDARGSLLVRQQVARASSLRHSVPPSSPECIFLRNGTSDCVRLVAQALIRGPNDTVLVSHSEDRLYRSVVELQRGTCMNYALELNGESDRLHALLQCRSYQLFCSSSCVLMCVVLFVMSMNEEFGSWRMDMDALQQALNLARQRGQCCRAVVLPGPGCVGLRSLTALDLSQVIAFCAAHGLAVIADDACESGASHTPEPLLPCVSARAVLAASPEPLRSSVALFSLSSGSGGRSGPERNTDTTCSGYLEISNVAPEVLRQLHKLAAVDGAPNFAAQVSLGIMSNPPTRGEISFPLYMKELKDFEESLRRRAGRMTAAINSIPGVRCSGITSSEVCGLFITLPGAAVEAARQAGLKPDEFYSLSLLHHTGILISPGSSSSSSSSSSQNPVNATVAAGGVGLAVAMPTDECDLDKLVTRFGHFHESFTSSYSGLCEAKSDSMIIDRNRIRNRSRSSGEVLIGAESGSRSGEDKQMWEALPGTFLDLLSLGGFKTKL